MATCTVCDTELSFPFYCNYCDNPHCTDHRLPENHSCPGLHSNSGQSVSTTTHTGTASHSQPGLLGWLLAPFVLLWWGLRALLNPAILSTLAVTVLVASATVGLGVQAIDDPVGDAVNTTDEYLTHLAESASEDGPASGSPDADTPPSDSTPGATESGGIDREALEQAIHEKVNDARTDRGYGALSVDAELRDIARYHSEDMAERGYFSHDSPDGETMGERYERFGYDCRAPSGPNRYKTGAENLFKRSTVTDLSAEAFAEVVVEGWLNSPGHRENLLDSDWRREGIGVAIADDGAVYVTQNFC